MRHMTARELQTYLEQTPEKPFCWEFGNPGSSSIVISRVPN